MDALVSGSYEGISVGPFSMRPGLLNAKSEMKRSAGTGYNTVMRNGKGRKANGSMRIIRLMAERIAKRFHPEKIILFGSYATGTASADSDADLLVVMNCRGSKREKAIEMDVAVSDLGMAKDIIVITSADAERLKGVPGTITSIALSEGRTLYERRV